MATQIDFAGWQIWWRGIQFDDRLDSLINHLKTTGRHGREAIEVSARVE